MTTQYQEMLIKGLQSVRDLPREIVLKIWAFLREGPLRLNAPTFTRTQRILLRPRPALVFDRGMLEMLELPDIRPGIDRNTPWADLYAENRGRGRRQDTLSWFSAPLTRYRWPGGYFEAGTSNGVTLWNPNPF